MGKESVDRREFLKAASTSVAVISTLPQGAFALDARRHVWLIESERKKEAPQNQNAPHKIKFAVIGLNHYHIYSQVDAVLRGGGELISFYAREPDLVGGFSNRYPQAKLAGNENEILEDGSIHLVLSAAIPDE